MASMPLAQAQLFSSGNNNITGNNVGIGTNSPDSPLQVNGDATVGDGFGTGTLNGNRLNILTGAINNGGRNGISFFENINFGMSIGYDGSGTGPTNAIRVYSNTDASLFTVQNGGNVGIGTDTPASKLQVEGSFTQVAAGPVGAPTSRWYGIGDPPAGFSSPNVGTTYGANVNWSQRNAYFGLLETGGAIDGFLAWQDQTSSSPNTGNALRIGFINGVGSNANFTERGTWLANGNLGIGDNTPEERLTIQGLTTTTVMVKSSATVEGTAQLVLSEGNSNNLSFEVEYDGSGVPTSSTNRGNQLLFNSKVNSTITTRMSINRDNGRVGIGTRNPTKLLEVNGDAAKPGGGMWHGPSDSRLKTDVRDFRDGLDVIMRINPVWFRYNGQLDLPTDREFVGTIAQDLREAAPYLVGEINFDAGDGPDVQGGQTQPNFLSADYSALTFVLINAIKEQQATIESQQQEIAELRNMMLQMQKGTVGTVTQREGEVLPGDFETVELFQNTPNPFNQATEISYVLPANVQRAQLYVYDLNGSQIKSFELTDRGRSSVTLEGSSLKAGMYIYTLIADGQEVATKRMILTR